MTSHGGYPICACPDCNPRRSFWALADVRKYEDGKSYERGDVDWRERSVPPYPSTPEQRALRPVSEPQETKPPKELPSILYPAQEDSVETIIKRNKNGAINTQSTVGKVVALALDKGCELKVGNVWVAQPGEPYERTLWLQGAHHGLRFSVTGTTVFVNGKTAPKEDLLVRLEEIKED